MNYCNCDLEMSGKHKVGCSEVERPKPAESSTMAAWRAEEVKNWTQALRNMSKINPETDVAIAFHNAAYEAIMSKLAQLLGIADDK